MSLLICSPNRGGDLPLEEFGCEECLLEFGQERVLPGLSGAAEWDLSVG